MAEPELYEALKGLVENIIEEYESEMSKEEISEIVRDVIPEIRNIVKEETTLIFNEINKNISRLFKQHLKVLLDRFSTSLNQMVDEEEN